MIGVIGSTQSISKESFQKAQMLLDEICKMVRNYCPFLRIEYADPIDEDSYSAKLAGHDYRLDSDMIIDVVVENPTFDDSCYFYIEVGEQAFEYSRDMNSSVKVLSETLKAYNLVVKNSQEIISALECLLGVCRLECVAISPGHVAGAITFYHQRFEDQIEVTIDANRQCTTTMQVEVEDMALRGAYGLTSVDQVISAVKDRISIELGMI